jgi:hypothetical protein
MQENLIQPDSFTPRTTRRQRRMYKHNHEVPYRNDRKPKGAGEHFQTMARWNDQAIHMPKRKKMKGWQREARRRA